MKYRLYRSDNTFEDVEMPNGAVVHYYKQRHKVVAILGKKKFAINNVWKCERLLNAESK